MMISTHQNYHYRDSAIAKIWADVRNGSGLYAAHAVVFLGCFAVCMALQYVDTRQFNGANVWMKPGKFYLSLALHVATIAWALSFAPAALKSRRITNWTLWGILVAGWYELIYITYRAALGEASHFNTAGWLNATLYQLMALGAVILVIGAAIIGWMIWRAEPRSIWTQAIALGFGLGAILTLIVGMTLGGNAGHWIGGDMTDATGVGIFKWSTTGGDLRVAHFVGLHAMQIVPFAALSGNRRVVYGVAALLLVLTAATYGQALTGIPLFRA
jgi:hypothetical protein